MRRTTASRRRALRYRVAATMGCFALFTISCKDSNEPLRAVALGIVTQPPSTAQSGVALSSAVVVELRDRNGDPFAQTGVPVTATIASGDGTLAGTTTVTTDAQGRAAFSSLTISGTVGPRTLSFTASGLSKAVSSSIALAAGPAATLAASGASTVQAVVNTAIATLPAVIVKDASGNPVSGISVAFSAPAGAGNLTGATATTNAAGTATLGGWTLPTTAGQYPLTATAASIPGAAVTFTVTATADAPTEMQPVAGGGQSVLYGSVLPTPLEVRVVDQYGNPTPGVVVTWGSFTGAGTVAPINVATDANGIVRSNYRLGTAPGANVIRASINPRGLTLDFTATALGFTNQIAVAPRHSCALDESGVAYCWGDNASGQLGINSTAQRAAPVPVAGNLHFQSISAGTAVTCALSVDDDAYCWGSNAFAGLGDGTQTLRSVPTLVSGGHKFVALSTGGQLTCGLTAGGVAYCWGDNGARQLGVDSTAVETCIDPLGNPDFSCSRVPVAVSGGLTFTSISAGPGHACAIGTDTKLYCWGFSYDFGGVGGGGLASSPRLAGGSLTFAEVTAGGAHTCGVVAPSSAYCWGNQTQVGLIGNGVTEATQESPALLSVSASHMSAGFWGTCAAAPDGRAFCWGNNSTGATGDGTTVVARTSPVTVVSAQSFTAISTSGYHACATTVNRQLYCWGENTNGQVGVGNAGGNVLGPTLVRP